MKSEIPIWYRTKYVRHCLANEHKVAAQCLMKLYDWYVSTGHGFRMCDRRFLSSLAEQYRRSSDLSRKQYESLHKLMPRYAGQIVRSFANETKLLKRMDRDGWLAPGRLEAARRERRP